MRPIEELYAIAEKQNIPVLTYPLQRTGSLSVTDGAGRCAIGLDPAIADGGTRERLHLGHELGHCATGSFYSIHAARDLRQRHENRADKWAIQALIPVTELDDAVAQGHTTLWDLAEHFGVTEPFMRKAVCYYTHGNLSTELYF